MREEDALRVLEELERTALLQTLRQAMRAEAEAGESLGEAGKTLLGLWADSIATIPATR